MLIRTSLFIAVGTAALIAVGGRAILSAGAPKPPLVITHGIASGDVTPTSAVVMGGLAIAKVGYGTWLRFVWPLLVLLAILTIVVLTVPVLV